MPARGARGRRLRGLPRRLFLGGWAALLETGLHPGAGAPAPVLVLMALEEVLHAPAVVALLVPGFQAQHLINRRLAAGYLADPFIPQALQAGRINAVDVPPEAALAHPSRPAVCSWVKRLFCQPS